MGFTTCGLKVEIIAWLWNHTDIEDFPKSISIRPYHQLFPAGPPDYILYPHGASVDKFLLVSHYRNVKL